MVSQAAGRRPGGAGCRGLQREMGLPPGAGLQGAHAGGSSSSRRRGCSLLDLGAQIRGSAVALVARPNSTPRGRPARCSVGRGSKEMIRGLLLMVVAAVRLGEDRISVEFRIRVRLRDIYRRSIGFADRWV